MKIKLHHIFLCLLFVTASVSVSYAQDSGAVEYETTDSESEKFERDKVLYSPGEGDTRYVKPSVAPSSTSKDSVAKDSITVFKAPLNAPVKVKSEQPAKAAEKQEQSKDDDSILSFNFLFYLIQKYKLQDVIE